MFSNYQYTWPAPSLVKRFVQIGSLLYLLFFLVYGFTNWWATRHSHWHQLYFSWELALPFVPEFVYVYLSLILFLILPVFFMDQRSVKPWALSYIFMTIVAGVIFFVYPTTHAVQRTASAVNENWLFSLIYILDMPHNLFPSLHVAFTTFVVQMAWFFNIAARVFWIMLLWWVLLTASVLLIQQHHVLDIVGGVLLSGLCYRFLFLRVYGLNPNKAQW